MRETGNKHKRRKTGNKELRLPLSTTVSVAEIKKL